MSIDPQRLEALTRVLTKAEAEARIVGYQRGWDHAAAVNAYGGDVRDEVAYADVPERFKAAETDHWFTAGWMEGVTDYGDAMDES